MTVPRAARKMPAIPSLPFAAAEALAAVIATTAKGLAATPAEIDHAEALIDELERVDSASANAIWEWHNNAMAGAC